MARSAISEKTLTVHHDIHPVAEALFYYTRRANGYPLTAAVKEMREQYPESRESIDSLFGILEDLEQRLDRASDNIDTERMHFFFDDLGESVDRKRLHGSNIATAVFMPSVMSYESFTSLETYQEQLSVCSVEEAIFRARVAFSVPNESWVQRECSDFTTFYDYISAFPATDDDRYRILGAIRHFDAYAQELMGMVRPVLEVLQENAPLYEPLLDRFVETYDGKNPSKVFGDDKDIQIFDRTAEIFDLYPCLFSVSEFFTMTYRMDMAAPWRNHIELGVLFDAARQYRKRDIPLKELASCIKVIGDPVRLHILSLLKDGDVYVQDLTEKLGLSFTTVSHHMTKLMMAGLVSSERRGIYVYYKANNDFLHWITDRVSAVILPK